MYHIELLPSSSASLTPGWTYVADRGYNAAQTAAATAAPVIGRKRGIRDPGGRGDLTSKESNAIARHLSELDRENYRDVQIPIRQKEKEGRGPRGKTTTNVRRILQSQKDFQYHLNEEEASSQTPAGPGSGSGANTPRPGIISRITKPAPAPAPPVTTTTTSRKRKHASRGEETPAAPPAAPPADKDETDEGGTDKNEAEKNDNKLIASEHDNDPLLRSRMPSAPSERIMQALVSEPPLSYNAARVGPSMSRKSPRFFCAICGYWGKIRCRGCHVRTCGLDCYKVHEESRCGAFL